jgi:hypothetical protein
MEPVAIIMHVVVSHADHRSPFFILLIIVVVFDSFLTASDFCCVALLFLMTQLGYSCCGGFYALIWRLATVHFIT